MKHKKAIIREQQHAIDNLIAQNKRLERSRGFLFGENTELRTIRRNLHEKIGALREENGALRKGQGNWREPGDPAEPEEPDTDSPPEGIDYIRCRVAMGRMEYDLPGGGTLIIPRSLRKKLRLIKIENEGDE